MYNIEDIPERCSMRQYPVLFIYWTDWALSESTHSSVFFHQCQDGWSLLWAQYRKVRYINNINMQHTASHWMSFVSCFMSHKRLEKSRKKAVSVKQQKWGWLRKQSEVTFYDLKWGYKPRGSMPFSLTEPKYVPCIWLFISFVCYFLCFCFCFPMRQHSTESNALATADWLNK